MISVQPMIVISEPFSKLYQKTHAPLNDLVAVLRYRPNKLHSPFAFSGYPHKVDASCKRFTGHMKKIAHELNSQRPNNFSLESCTSIYFQMDFRIKLPSKLDDYITRESRLSALLATCMICICYISEKLTMHFPLF